MAAPNRIPRPSGELTDALRTQLDFLDRSAAAYDEGFEDEAIRLATVVRTLLSDGGRGSQSLLQQMGLRHRLTFVDTSLGHKNLRPNHGGWNAGLARMVIDPRRGGRYEAPLGDSGRDRPGVGFSMWWNKKIYREPGLSRRALVAAMANQDGGAHVDSLLDPAYLDLTRNNALGWSISSDEFGERPFEGNGATASMRQIAWELRETLREQVAGDGAILGKGKPLGRNDPCFCGSGVKFKKCCGA